MATKELKYFNNRLMGSLTPEVCKNLETVIALKEQQSPIKALKKTIFTLEDRIVQEVLESEVNIPIEDRPVGELTDGQTLTVGFAYIAEDCLIGDSVGLGKTVETSALINLKRKEKFEKFGNIQGYRVLMLTENALVEQLQHELVKFTGEYVYALNGDKASSKRFAKKYPNGVDGTVVGSHSLINQSEFYSWMDSLQDGDKDFKVFDLLVVDESSILGNTKTQTYKNALKLKNYVNNVVLLNASPFESNLDYLYSQIKYVDEDFLPTKTVFQKNYYMYDYNNIGGYGRFNGNYKNYEEFKHRVNYRYFFQTRKEQGAIVKNVKSEILTVPQSREQRQLIKESSMNRMIYDTPAIIAPWLITDEENTPKLKLLRQVLSKAGIERGEQVLIYSVYKDSQQIISDFITSTLGYSCEILNGDIKRKRSEIINNFKQNKIPILITNIQKGLNFGSVKNIVFYGYDPNPSKMIQMEGRVTRSFNIENKNIYLLATEGKEINTIKSIVAKRYDYTTKFASQDISGIGSLLLDSL